MNKLKVLILLVVAIVAADCSSESDSSSSGSDSSSSESDSSSSESGSNEGGDSRGPLFLTKFIQSGNIAEGRKLATVKQPELVKKGIKSYSGYLTVNETAGSNLFFWYFPAKNNQKNAPLILWLQGGPGASSLYGLFMENGPVYVNSKNTLSEREFSWNQNLNLLYIDNPVGAGFSFTNDATYGYLTNQVDVGKNLFSAVRQFLILFPELKKNAFYVAGESYGGKYVPALCYQIYLNQNSKDENDRIKLEGFSIGNGVTDPVHQLHFGQLFSELGFIDNNALPTFIEYQTKAIDLINQGQFTAALGYAFSLINTQDCLFNNLTGFTSAYNFLVPNGYDDAINVVSEYMVNSGISKYLNVGDQTFVPFDDNNLVLAHLQNDILDSVATWVEVLLNNYKGNIYAGMLDLLAGASLTENYLLTLDYSGAAAFQTAPTDIWLDDGEIAGYVRIGGNLRFTKVRAAGHMVPHDQPKWAFKLISILTGTGL